MPVRDRARVAVVLTLATLGCATNNRNDSICVTQPRQVRKALYRLDIAGVIGYKHQQCTKKMRCEYDSCSDKQCKKKEMLLCDVHLCKLSLKRMSKTRG
jgi:hypothetical protein